MACNLTKFLIITLSMIIISCSSALSTEDLTKELGPEIVQHICAEFDINESNVKMKQFSLVHEEGNKYSGIMNTEYDGYSQTFDIEVIYDGENYTFQWELISEN